MACSTSGIAHPVIFRLSSSEDANLPVGSTNISKKTRNLSILRLPVRLVNRARKNGPGEANMASLQTAIRSSKSIAGAALLGLGMFILYKNMACAVVWVRLVLCANCSQEVGVLPAFILALSRSLPAADHQHSVQGFLRHMLMSSWPLLLVMLGTVLSRDAFTDNINAVSKKDCPVVDLETSRSTLK